MKENPQSPTFKGSANQGGGQQAASGSGHGKCKLRWDEGRGWEGKLRAESIAGSRAGLAGKWVKVKFGKRPEEGRARSRWWGQRRSPGRDAGQQRASPDLRDGGGILPPGKWSTVPFGGSFSALPILIGKVNKLLTLLTPARFWEGGESSPRVRSPFGLEAECGRVCGAPPARSCGSRRQRAPASRCRRRTAV